MVTIKKEVLDKVLANLNLTNTKVIQEGLMSAIAGGANKMANWANNTDMAAAQKGLVFLKPDGKTFVNIPGVDPNSQTGKYLTREYTAAKYSVPTDQQKATMNTSNTQTHSPQEMIGNLKASTDTALKQIAKMAMDMEASLKGKTSLTSQESAGYYNKLINFIIASIKQTQANMPSFPGAQPIAGPQAVNQLPANPSTQNPAQTFTTAPAAANLTPQQQAQVNSQIGPKQQVGQINNGAPTTVNGTASSPQRINAAGRAPNTAASGIKGTTAPAITGPVQPNVNGAPAISTSAVPNPNTPVAPTVTPNAPVAGLQGAITPQQQQLNAQQQAAAKQLLAQQQAPANTFTGTNK